MSPKLLGESRDDIVPHVSSADNSKLTSDSLRSPTRTSGASTQLDADTPEYAHTPTPSSSSRAPTRSSRTSRRETPNRTQEGERERTSVSSSYLEPKEVVRKLCMEKESSFLKAWFHHFDQDFNRKVKQKEFTTGMEILRYPGNIDGLWEDLCKGADLMDDDEKGQIHHDADIGFEDIDAEEATVWNTFRKWCGSAFSSGRDMIRQCKQVCQHQEEGQSRRSSLQEMELLHENEFVQGIGTLIADREGELIGFQGHEQKLFQCIDLEADGVISTRHLKWLEHEVRQKKQKDAAKRKAEKMAEHKAQGAQAMQAALEDFKATLRKQAGTLFKAWRRFLDPDGSMSVQRADLFKVCNKLNWKGDVRALWKALDHDNSQVSTLEELHPHGAQLLAQFRQWAMTNFGPKPASEMFRAFDKKHLRKLHYKQFLHEMATWKQPGPPGLDCQVRGFEGKAKTLVPWLDWEDKKCIHEEDFAFLDHWKPPPWLTAQPSYQAAEAFKQHLLKKFGHMLKAWRGVLDKDSSNCCNWHEFQEAARQVKFNGDVAGAWLCFDKDMGGYISLKEMDEAAHNSLVEFKQWADEEFGGVRSAFKVLDVDNSGELNYREFRGACRNFGFHGDVRTLFESLDQKGEARLQYKEVSFLDDWETKLPVAEGLDFHQEPQKESEQASGSALLDYVMESPGPGAYEVLPGFGATPFMPTARHGGSYSFTNRRVPKLPKSVGPARYQPSLRAVVDRKPAWGFGKAPREQQAATPRLQPRCSSAQEERYMPAPGPGSYDLRTTFSGPRYSMKPRRAMRLHPCERARAISR